MPLHALATVTFGVDHIVSGVAINIIGLGASRFFAEAYFANLEGGGVLETTGLDRPPDFTIPGLSDAATALAEKRWFVVSDVASVVSAFSTNLNVLTLMIFLMVPRHRVGAVEDNLGLRLRSCGENPQAAESLGVARDAATSAIRGAGHLRRPRPASAAAILALVASSGFVTGQTNGRGYIGLAAMIFGNWRPGGILAGASMFGYTDSLPLRSTSTIHALLLLVAIGLIVFALFRLVKGQRTSAAVLGVFGLLFGLWYAVTEEVPRDFTSMTPYIATLLVLAFASQRLRMPKADGQIYRKGSAG